MQDGIEPPDEARRLAGRYRIETRLAQGGMGEVYYGFDERIGRRVAIKMLKASDPVPTVPDSPEAVELLDTARRDRKRFLREIHTTALLEHPGIPAVYDTGEDLAPDGSPQVWLVMQLLRGSTLEAVLDRTDYTGDRPTIAWAASIAAQIAAVLADVHRVDIVHRDIKPANIMIVDGGLVKVLDFGVAILRGAGALPRLTQIGRTVGTPAYMSPEQWRGRPVTAASDVYSLGCLLLELLTGDVPFHATTRMLLRDQHLSSPPPSARSRRSGIPPQIDALVTSMLGKEADKRPTAEAVYDALLPFITDAEPASDESRDPTRPFRRPLLAPPKRTEPAGNQPKLTDAEAAQIQGNARALLDDEHATEAIRLLESGLERTDDPFLTLSLRHLLAAALFYDGEYSRAASLFDVVGREYRRYLETKDPLVLECAYHAGHAYAEIGKPGKALPQLRFYVLNTDPAADPEEAAKYLESRFVIAQMLAAEDLTDEAVAELRAVRPLLVAAYGPDAVSVQNLDKQIDRLTSSVTDTSSDT